MHKRITAYRLKLPAARPIDETCRLAQVVSLRSSRYGECARWSIFMKYPG